MTEYTGRHFTIKNSVCFDGESVNVLECKDTKGSSRGTCFRCGKQLRRHWWTVQTELEDLEICDVGPDCVEKLS